MKTSHSNSAGFTAATLAPFQPDDTFLFPPSSPHHPHRRARYRRAFEVAGKALTETLFPSRCALCDRPGAPLCERCAKALPYIDTTTACPRCGAPWGFLQCTECNQTVLEPFGLSAPPYDQAVSACRLTEATRRLITVYKDQLDRPLAFPLAAIMARYVPYPWLKSHPLLTFIPASAQAKRQRGFDHGELLAQELSDILGLSCAPLLCVGSKRDQRKLGKTKRIENMRGTLSVLPGASVASHLILIDDVCTTGSTLFAASEALRACGAQKVWALTFGRT